MKVIKADAISSRGQRNVTDGEVALLEGFEFNKNAGLAKTFGAPFTASIDRATGAMIVDIPGFRAADMIAAPEGATHFRLKSVGAAIDFEGNTCSVATSESADLPINEEVQGPLRLSQTVAPASINPMFLVFGIEFLQLVNGAQYPLRNGTFNAMAVVSVNGFRHAELNTNEQDTEERRRSLTRRSTFNNRTAVKSERMIKQSLAVRFEEQNTDSQKRIRLGRETESIEKMPGGKKFMCRGG
jgi:hypothetical protein